MAIATVIPFLLTSPAYADAAEDNAAQPPKITVIQLNNQQVADGFLFVAPKTAGIGGGTSPGAVGPEIVDNKGRPVWFLPVTNGQSPADFRVQKYHNRPVLTWAQEKGFGGLAQDESVDYIYDNSYRLVATVHAGDGLNSDAHEFLISPEDTALITVYNAVPRDLSSVGGSARGQLIEGVVQEIDIASGRVIFEWHSLDHVGIEESYQPLPTSSATAWDYFHLNAVSIDQDGDLLISARHTSTVYKIDRHTGSVIWRLGGKRSDFNLGLGVRFWYQHNPIVAGR
ncbi:MAG: aryl-sulfate sulfotransferase [Verrucomicrobia bacterium]|nr:aryl-sulfate sulfotransferase [Verrucomicrobiota bacterium]